MKYHRRIITFALLIIVFVTVLYIGIKPSRTNITQDRFPLSQKWSVRLDGNVAALSIMSNKIALARTKNKLYTLDIQSGEVVWEQGLSWPTAPHPALANKETVYAIDGNVVKALSQIDGSMIWEQPVYNFDGLVLDASETVLVVKDGRGIHLYDASTGELLHDNPGCRAVKQAYIGDDSVFVPCDGLLRIDVSTGQNSWWNTNKGIIGNVGYADEVMYFSQAEPAIAAFDLNNWRELWHVPMAIDGFESFDVFNDFVFFMDFSNFCALRRLDGSKQWCTEDVSYPQNPSVVGDVVYVFNGNHKEITAFELMNGRLIGKLEIQNLNYFSTYQQLMVSSDDVLLFASARDVFAFSK